MKLTDDDIAEYQKLVKKQHGIDISKAATLEDALSLINFVHLTHNLPNKNAENANVE